MTNVEIGNSVSVSVLPQLDQRFENARSLASDLLQGETSDYIFFYAGSGQINTTTYYYKFVLLVGDFTLSSTFGAYTMENVRCYNIYSIRESTQKLTNYSFDGTELDLSPAPVGSFSGSGTSRYTDYQYSTQFFTYEKNSVSIAVDSGAVVYSSLKNHPRLIEGGQNYAYAAFILAFACIAFRLADRLFRRVY